VRVIRFLNENKYLLIISLLIPLISIFFDSYTYEGGTAYSLGFPQKFLTYYDSLGPPENRLEIFSSISRFALRIDIAFISGILYFFIPLTLISWLIKRLLKIRNKPASV
jgi:hypothetical protein